MGLGQQSGHEQFDFRVGLHELAVSNSDFIAERRERSAILGFRLAESRAFFGDLRRPLAAIDGEPQRKTGGEKVLAVDGVRAPLSSTNPITQAQIDIRVALQFCSSNPLLGGFDAGALFAQERARSIDSSQ